MYPLNDPDSPEKGYDLKEKVEVRHRSIAGDKVRKFILNQPSRTPAISQIKDLEIGDYVDMPELVSKRNSKKSPNNMKGSIWSKLTEQRGREMKARSVSNIGPGEYNDQ